MTSQDTAIVDHPVVDDQQQRVGKVTDVIYDELNAEPRWATVKLGLLSGERIIPLDGTYVSTEGVLVVPFGRAAVKNAPRAPRDHVLSSSEKRQIDDHFANGA